MYRVEKFFPTECPKCQCGFRGDKTYGILLGDIKDGKKVPRQPPGRACDIIICDNCKNQTLRIMLEVRQVSDVHEADRLFNEEGFCNMQKVDAYGNQTQDYKIVYYGADKKFGEVQFLVNPSLKSALDKFLKK